MKDSSGIVILLIEPKRKSIESIPVLLRFIETLFDHFVPILMVCILSSAKISKKEFFAFSKKHGLPCMVIDTWTESSLDFISDRIIEICEGFTFTQSLKPELW